MQIFRNKDADTKAVNIPVLRDMGYRFARQIDPVLYECADIESGMLRKALASVDIVKPVYVTGLARAGTTLLLEIIASQPGVATHRYKDFPLLPVVHSWRRFVSAFGKKTPPQERSHQDGVLVSPDSPEAFEEMLWMHFFPDMHRQDSTQVLSESTRQPDFERFYNEHIRKLLLSEQASRYAVKGNYNLSRLAYIQHIFNDARFVIAIRNPLAHIASLVKQHQWFCKMQAQHPALLRYMRQAGHFEFGLDRRVIHLGDSAVVDRIHEAWRQGRDVEGWALYWEHIYGYVREIMETELVLSRNTHIVFYEALCQQPAVQLEALFSHCALGTTLPSIDLWSQKIAAPTYYRADFTPDELDNIRAITGKTAAYFGYTI